MNTLGREIFFQRDLIDSIGSEYDLEDDYIAPCNKEENSEEMKQKMAQKAAYWSQIAKKCKEHISSSSPSVEYEVNNKIQVTPDQ